MTIGQVLNNYPRAEAIKDKILSKLYAPIEEAFESANRQIRETKRFFNLPSARGLVVFVNRDDTILEPKTALKIPQFLMQKKRNQEYRFKQSDYVTYVSHAHYFEFCKDKIMPFCILVRNDISLADLETLKSFESAFEEFIGIPGNEIDVWKMEDGRH